MPKSDYEELSNDLIAIVRVFLETGKESMLAIHEIRAAFGAPGDYGYNSKKGKALLRLYSNTQALAALIEGNTDKGPSSTEQDKAGEK